jgi:hypothetical protein
LPHFLPRPFRISDSHAGVVALVALSDLLPSAAGAVEAGMSESSRSGRSTEFSTSFSPNVNDRLRLNCTGAASFSASFSTAFSAAAAFPAAFYTLSAASGPVSSLEPPLTLFYLPISRGFAVGALRGSYCLISFRETNSRACARV